MRYRINFDKTINQLVPHYIGGRKLILYLQALMSPLQTDNDEFDEYAKETRIEALMTSQIGFFEWFLNHKLSRYFSDDDGQITISNGSQLGVPIYYGNASIPLAEHMVMYRQNKLSTPSDMREDEGVETVNMHYQNEKTDGNTHSFIVTTPSPDKELITKDKYEAMLRYWIDQYRIAGKTYLIKYK